MCSALMFEARGVCIPLDKGSNFLAPEQQPTLPPCLLTVLSGAGIPFFMCKSMYCCGVLGGTCFRPVIAAVVVVEAVSKENV